MKKKYERVYRFRIILLGVEPPIWRGIEVPETFSFWDLHVAVQDAMGWLDYHLHEFRVKSPSGDEAISVGTPTETFDGFNEDMVDEVKFTISQYFSENEKVAYYDYDFGDGWEHAVELEEVLPRKKNVKYPRCVDGARACPPEDCGGYSGYEEMLEAIADPEHEQYVEMTEWLGEEFDPEYFNPKEVKFDDPVKRRKIAFG